MKGVNVKYDYRQSVTECRDKLVELCNRWEMDDSDKDIMMLEVDDDFMSTIYSVVRILSQPRNKGEVLDELVNEIKKEYLHRVGTQFDNAIFEMEKIAEKLSDE